MRKLFVVVLLLGTAYFVKAYWPLGKRYFAVRFAAQECAGSFHSRDSQGRALDKLVADIRRDTGLIVSRYDVSYDVNNDRPHVTVNVTIPVKFMFLNTQNSHSFKIEASASRIYGATE